MTTTATVAFECSHDIVIDASASAVFDYVTNPQSWPEWLAASHAIDSANRPLEAGEVFSEKWHIRSGEVALNWIVRKAGVASIIVGARTMTQLEDNLGASTWSLSDADMVRLDEASALPPIYPYDMHRSFMADRNPVPGLLPVLS